MTVPSRYILLAEDNPADVLLVREAIEDRSLSCELCVIADGQQMIEFIEEIDADQALPCPQLVLLDLNLPKRQGDEILKSLRASERCGQIPVVILTASESPAAHRIIVQWVRTIFPMELIAEILTNPTTGALDADWPVQSDDVRASQRRIEPRFPTKRLTAIYSTGSGDSKRMFCSILDVSQHGMRVRTAHPLTPGPQVRVTLGEMSAIARCVTATG